MEQNSLFVVFLQLIPSFQTCMIRYTWSWRVMYRIGVTSTLQIIPSAYYNMPPFPFVGKSSKSSYYPWSREKSLKTSLDLIDINLTHSPRKFKVDNPLKPIETLTTICRKIYISPSHKSIWILRILKGNRSIKIYLFIACFDCCICRCCVSKWSALFWVNLVLPELMWRCQGLRCATKLSRGLGEP